MKKLILLTLVLMLALSSIAFGAYDPYNDFKGYLEHPTDEDITGYISLKYIEKEDSYSIKVKTYNLTILPDRDYVVVFKGVTTDGTTGSSSGTGLGFLDNNGKLIVKSLSVADLVNCLEHELLYVEIIELIPTVPAPHCPVVLSGPVYPVVSKK
jgi:hypothetical protein